MYVTAYLLCSLKLLGVLYQRTCNIPSLRSSVVDIEMMKPVGVFRLSLIGITALSFYLRSACLSVCLFVRLFVFLSVCLSTDMSQNCISKFPKIFCTRMLPVAVDRSSSEKSALAVFVDDVMFSHKDASTRSVHLWGNSDDLESPSRSFSTASLSNVFFVQLSTDIACHTVPVW